MTASYQAWTANLSALDRALTALEPRAAALGVGTLKGREWYELLRHKLLPQATGEPLLVVAVVGGTNIGKSVVFNQLAGQNASGVSPLAAGTKHPVCLVPKGFDDEAGLRSIFQGFELRRWQSAEQPLVADDEHLLFWRSAATVPPRLLLLDTPDIDSDAEVNWQRADTVRQVADVLIAVLTQQKYNDAAVKQFFRKAAEADKAVIVIFNQCDLELDAPYWPKWLAVFVESTGIKPEMVYVAPHDRRAANDLRLPFYEVGRDGMSPPSKPSDLRAELGSLHFDEIKIRTFRGAMAEVTDGSRGAGAYLNEIRAASRQFEAAERALSATEMARVRWPVVPASLLVEEITRWWDERRPPWSRTIHGVYRTVGKGLTWPIRAAWQGLGQSTTDPVTLFQVQQRDAIVETIEKVLGELQRLAELGNEILRPRLRSLLSGHERARLIERIEADYEALPTLDDEYRAYLREELDAWRKDNPRAVWWLQSLDHVAALARPVITVSLVVTGGAFAGDVVHTAATQVVGHTATQIATEAAITGGVTAGGEALVSATGDSIKQAAARLFRRLQNRYASQRAAWLAAWLERELLGGMLAELREGAAVAESAPFREVEAALSILHDGAYDPKNKVMQ